MGRKQMSFSTGIYSYGKVERALGAALYADKTIQAGALRGRLKRLSTLGLPEGGPGKGARRLYSLEEAHQLLVAILMEDAGLDPVVVARAVKKAWPMNLTANAKEATVKDTRDRTINGVFVHGNPIILDMRLSTVTGPWRTGDPDAGLKWVRLIPRYNKRSYANLRKHWAVLKKRGWTEADLLRQIDEVGQGYNDLDEADGWLVVRNYSQKAWTLESALGKDL
jgi:hypothetical protein